MKSEEQRKQQREERRASKIPKFWYKPWVWIPPKKKEWRDKKGRLVTKILERGYFKLTHEAGTIIESGKQRYEVKGDGSLRNLTKEDSWRDKHRKGQKLSQGKG